VSDDHRTYQHRWNQGDLVVWDNRCLLHRCPYQKLYP
jgi:alpha-ketoglutarate-dependent taurine dioxygenase